MSGLDPTRERRWRHLANWLWLAPLAWWLASGAWYASSKDAETVITLVFVPAWLVLAGSLAYSLVILRARWGTTPLIVLAAIGVLVGCGAWRLAGIHAALTCTLVAPLIVGGGLLRIPPSASLAPLRAVLAVILGIAEPFLVLGAGLAITLLIVNHKHHLPGIGWWWAVAVAALALLAWSAWLLRRWRRKA